MKAFLLLLALQPVVAKPSGLETISSRLNRELPELYDSVTKLMRTTVENGQLVYHFVLNADRSEFERALPKVREQVLKTICGKKIERNVLLEQNASIIYRYENHRGQSLGEFVIRPEYCKKGHPE